jgi:hypothetical protein
MNSENDSDDTNYDSNDYGAISPHLLYIFALTNPINDGLYSQCRFFYVHIRRNLGALGPLVALVRGVEALLLNPFLNLETCLHQVPTH